MANGNSMRKAMTIGQYVVQASDWSYWGETGPNYWPGVCKKGTNQSPINIVTDDAVKTDLAPLKFIRYDFAFSANIINNGHTVQITLNGVPIHLKGGGLPSTYVLEQMHFHWGAEHTIDGTRDALELHFVHYDKQYDNMTVASEYENGIAVVAVLFELSEEDNENLESILNATESVSTWVGGSTAKIPTKIIPYLLLPADHTTFYRYQGSLTTPECKEGVIWTVMTEKLKISQSQLTSFMRVESNSGLLFYNYRPLQELGSRTVYHHLEGYSAASSSVLRSSLLFTLLNLPLISHSYSSS
ncbi:putative carbonic anhydrase 3 isoform X2 [Cephus cinctus]|uniref:Carbonic anhydrase 3 isoform X2 n=1 Tax=Cephus cinctus TaxID=211228 RepID=A0AAJ7W0B6_CEPCN|nr:putative carbonic anhydrase 3 isoform X2 [Cephus cinctus]